MKKIPFLKLYLYYLFGALPLSLLFAFLSLFHKFPIRFNGKPTYGIIGFIACLIFTPLWVFLITCLSWVALSLGRWLYGLFCRLIKIKIDDSDLVAQKENLFN